MGNRIETVRIEIVHMERTGLQCARSPVPELKVALLEDPDFSIQRICEAFSISTSNLSHKFKSCANLTVSEYILSLRMERAKELLCDTSLPIAEIALRLGYSDTSSFGKKFKERATCSHRRQGRLVPRLAAVRDGDDQGGKGRDRDQAKAAHQGNEDFAGHILQVQHIDQGRTLPREVQHQG